MGIKGFVKRILTEKEDKRYERRLRDRQVTYGEWAAALEAGAENGEIDLREPKRCGSALQGKASRGGGAAQGGSGPEGGARGGSGPEGAVQGGSGPEDAAQGGLKDGAKSRCEDGSKGVDFAVICGGRGTFSAGMLSFVRSFFRGHPEALLLYGDEDVWERAGKGAAADPGCRKLPWFKPDWSPDLLDSFFYFGSVVILRKGLFWRASGEGGRQGEGMPPEPFDFLESWEPERWDFRADLKSEESDFGTKRGSGKSAFEADREAEESAPGKNKETAELDSGQEPEPEEGRMQGIAFYKVRDWDAYERWVHSCVRLAGGYERGRESIGHVPKILFHCESREAQERYMQRSSFPAEREEARLRDFRDSRRLRGAGENKASDCAAGMVSIVIPSKDQPEILESCLKGCIMAAGGGKDSLPFEIIVVDNGSSGENQEKIRELLDRVTPRCPRVFYLYQQQEFNFSRMCNLGAEQARGDFLLFLNDDVELSQPGCLERMAALACREYTGAVGLKLYYPDSRRIQHAGITNLPMGPVHKLQFLEDDRAYYYGANRGLRNVLAVTAACFMVEKRKYLEAGGFAEELRVAFNDVDFCFRLYELGYHNVCVNDRYAYHHESLSRGGDESPEKLERLLGERERLYKRHPTLEGADPYYSPFLNREGLDTGIRPAYLTAGNRVQRIRGPFRNLNLSGYRQDGCLMVRVEDCRNRRLLGYGVVLGDDNACYGRELLFRRVKKGNPEDGGRGSYGERDFCPADGSEGDRVYAVEIRGQYRPDLEANMADQVNVGLGGFDVEIGQEAVPEGRYQVGLATRNRVTGLRLVNWSGRCVEL